MGPVATAQPRRDWEYVEAWGMSSGRAARVIRPRSTDELQAALAEAQSAGVSLAPRGAGCSYGDASTLKDGWVLDLTRMNEVLSFDPESGVLEAEAGLSVRGAWRHILPHGWWPYVVSGTMHPTLAGAAAMNIHGKNNFRVGTFGDHVLEFDLVLPSGEVRTASREENPDLFHAAIGGFGMLGLFSRVVMDTKRVHSGLMEVRGVSTHDLAEMMEVFEAEKAGADYLVGWIDCFPGGDFCCRLDCGPAESGAAGAEAWEDKSTRAWWQTSWWRSWGCVGPSGGLHGRPRPRCGAQTKIPSCASEAHEPQIPTRVSESCLLR